MPCSDSSSGLNIFLTPDEKIDHFVFAKVTCSSEIRGETGLSAFVQGKSIEEVLDLEFPMLVSALGLHEKDESQFIMYLELEALKAGLAEYAGIDSPHVDRDRCRISAIEYSESSIEIALIILPPKELPKIISCHQQE